MDKPTSLLDFLSEEAVFRLEHTCRRYKEAW